MHKPLIYRFFALLPAGLMVISGCTTLDPYTREETMSKTARGAAIGAAAGAVVGLITGDNSAQRKRQALIFAGVGALTGGAAGAYMDRQEQALRRRLDGTGVSVTRIGDNLTLNMPGNITFAFDSADINAEFYSILDSVGLVLKEYDKTFIEIAGHTDSVGSDNYNQRLSQRRAGSVAAYLRSRGVQSNRLLTVGAGEQYPVAENSTEAGRAANRRVELTIVPVTAG